MGRVPLRLPPRHLAFSQRSRVGAREHYVAEWILAAVAMVLTAAVVVANISFPIAVMAGLVHESAPRSASAGAPR